MITPVTVAYGDGIGPEIMEAALYILREAGAELAIESIELGERIYNMGAPSGILPKAWESLARTKTLLLAPTSAPVGEEYKNLNVTLRKTLGLFAKVCHVRSYHPFVESRHPAINLTIISENEESLYASTEYRRSEDSYHALKPFTRAGSERVLRYAFEYAQQHNRKQITCITRNGIVPQTDGFFRKLFDLMGREYPELKKEHLSAELAAARMATHPESFDVIVTENTYGDILTAIAAELSGASGLLPVVNIGDGYAIFETYHGPSPDMEGEGTANPSGMLHAAILMMAHIGQSELASKVHNAWLKALEDDVHMHAGTRDFAEAVVERVKSGAVPTSFAVMDYSQMPHVPASVETTSKIPDARKLIGVDIYFTANAMPVNELAELAQSIEGNELTLKNLSCKGVKIWPDAAVQATHPTDQYRARFRAPKDEATSNAAIAALLNRAQEKNIDFTHIENLYFFDGVPAFSIAEGE
jgi:isocitrate dehydrogenase